MPDVLSNVMPLDAFGLFEISCWGLEAIHFRAQADELTRRDRSGLAFKFSEFAAVVVVILWKFSVEITRVVEIQTCLLYTSPSPRDRQKSRMPSSA